MEQNIISIVEKWKHVCLERGVFQSIRSGADLVVADALNRLSIPHDTALAYLYQNLVGPFSSLGPERFPQLLDIKNETRNVESFTEELRGNYPVSKNILAISEIDSLIGLFYDVSNDAVFYVELDLEFPQFLQAKLTARWRSSDEFLSDFFRGSDIYFGNVE